MAFLKRKWLALWASFFLMAAAPGFLIGAGVMYIDILETFDSTRPVVSALYGLIVGFYGVLGFGNGMFVGWLGSRQAGMIASVVATVSFIALYFADSIVYLFIFLAAGIGISSSVLFIASENATRTHFHGKAQRLAISLILFAVGLGGMVWPPIMSFLIQEYGLKGALLLYGGIFSNCIPFSTFLETPWRKQDIATDSRQVAVTPRYVVRINVTTSSISTDLTSTRHITNQDDQEQKRDTSNKSKRRISFDDLKELLKNIPFLLETLNFICLGLTVTLLSIIMDHTGKLKFQSSDGVLVISAVNLTNSLIRFLPPLLKQIPRLGVLMIPPINAVLSGISLVAIPSVAEYTLLAFLFCIGLGVHIGIILATFPLIAIKLLDSRLFPLAVGLSQTLLGISSIVSGQVIGAFQETYGSYDTLFYMYGGMILSSGILLTIPLLMKTCRT